MLLRMSCRSWDLLDIESTIEDLREELGDAWDLFEKT
jgi:hypothetical protein